MKESVSAFQYAVMSFVRFVYQIFSISDRKGQESVLFVERGLNREMWFQYFYEKITVFNSFLLLIIHLYILSSFQRKNIDSLKINLFYFLKSQVVVRL